MKLRNKKTGEIKDFGYLQSDHIAPFVLTTYENDKPEMYSYNSLAELNEEWEDYEEPKGYWFIDVGTYEVDWCEENEDLEADKQIGNYFETKEEAEKAVEKLKAWKRLKDKGFRFKKWESYEETTGLSFSDRYMINSYTAIFDFNKPCRKYEIENEVKDDLDLLFGE